MSASHPPPAVPDESPPPADWSDLTPEERAELREAFATARENQRNGVPGIPLDEVLPQYRRAG